MPISHLNRVRGGADRAFDADVLSWRDAVVANGGSVSLARQIVVDQFVFSEKEAGNWALTDDYLGLWAENAAQALTSLKQRRLATALQEQAFADLPYVPLGQIMPRFAYRREVTGIAPGFATFWGVQRG